MLISGLLRQPLQLLPATALLPRISQRLSPCPEPIAQQARIHGHVRAVVTLMHGQILQRRPADAGGLVTSVRGDGLEAIAMGGREGSGHG